MANLLMYCDDARFCVVGAARAVRLLRAFRRVIGPRGLRLPLSRASKQMTGCRVVWLGACLAAGLGLLFKAASVVEVKAQYDGPGAAARYDDCRIDGPGRRGNLRSSRSRVFALPLAAPIARVMRAQASGSAPRAPCASRRPRT